jgi:hypothetical protein
MQQNCNVEINMTPVQPDVKISEPKETQSYGTR